MLERHDLKSGSKRSRLLAFGLINPLYFRPLIYLWSHFSLEKIHWLSGKEASKGEKGKAHVVRSSPAKRGPNFFSTWRVQCTRARGERVYRTRVFFLRQNVISEFFLPDEACLRPFFIQFFALFHKNNYGDSKYTRSTLKQGQFP